MLEVTGDSADIILGRAMEVINATPSVLLDLCDHLNSVLLGRASLRTSSPRPVISVRQKLLDDAVAEARRRVTDAKDSMEACAAKWIERNRKEGSLYFRHRSSLTYNIHHTIQFSLFHSVFPSAFFVKQYFLVRIF